MDFSVISYENQQRAIFDGDGEYGIPHIEPIGDHNLPLKWIGFEQARAKRADQSAGVHFFLDDRRFNCCWNRPDKYGEMLTKFPCVAAPDFSMFTDFPKAVQVFNHFKKHWLAAYWQQRFGIRVIPTISWSDESSFEWCFDGEPQNSVVLVSTVGTLRNKEAHRIFTLGYSEMIQRLSPSVVLISGKVPDDIDERVPIQTIGAFEDKLIAMREEREQRKKDGAKLGRTR